MRAFQNHMRRSMFLMRLQPPIGAKTPAIPAFQAGKAEFIALALTGGIL
jgi:hypothetical protein